LTGKYRPDDRTPPDTRAADDEEGTHIRYRMDDRAWSIIDAVGKVAAEIGKTSAQVALNWVVHRRGVTSPIVGARTVAQLDDNLGAIGWELDDEQRRALIVASAERLGYPYEFVAFAND
jgi:aryl-alcohol dehydrogenase-like predicted oxidoreductase